MLSSLCFKNLLASTKRFRISKLKNFSYTKLVMLSLVASYTLSTARIKISLDLYSWNKHIVVGIKWEKRDGFTYIHKYPSVYAA